LRAEIKIYTVRQEFGAAVAERWLDFYRESVAEHGDFHVALAGGSTPRQLYHLLSRTDISRKVDWQRVHIYFGDERFVPGDHPDSNFRMARESLLDHVPVPDANIHRIETESGDMQEVAYRYEQVLVNHLPKAENGVPRFDLVLLGIGPDGHTASLFPDTDILNQQERYVDAVYVKQKSSWRVSITFPVINSARHVLFLVAGADKRSVVQQILSGSPHSPQFPVEMLKPLGQVEFYLDSEAAGRIDSRD